MNIGIGRRMFSTGCRLFVVPILCLCSIILVFASCSGKNYKIENNAAEQMDEVPQPQPETEEVQQSGGADKPQSPTAAAVLKELIDWNQTAVLQEADEEHPGFKGYYTSVNGKPVWPPSGDSCPQYITCCNDSVEAGIDDASNNSMAILCQMAVTIRGDCKEGLITIKKVLAESGEQIPASCE